MRQLERYVMMEVLRVFGAMITISTLLFVFVGAFSEAQKLDLGIWQVLQIIPYAIPNLMPYTIPATLLLTVCVVYGRMAGDSEIIAARAAGVHIFHLIWPSLFVAATLSIGTLVLTDQVIPWAFSNIERVVALAMEDIFLDKLRAQNHISAKGYGVTINVTGVRGRNLINPTIRVVRGGKASTVQAEEAHIEFDLRNQLIWLSLRKIRGKFAKNIQLKSEYERISYALPKHGGNSGSRVKRTRELLVALDGQHERQRMAKQKQAIESAFALARGDFEAFSSTSFNAHEQTAKSAVHEIRGLRTEYYNRFAMSVNCFFVVLLGTPFSILMAKKQFLTTFLFCFLPILTVYYPIAMMTQNLSKSGQLDPSWSAWMANGALLVAAIYYMHRVVKN